MKEFKSWRDMLASIADSNYERKHIAQVAGVKPITLTRWIAGSSKPRPENISQLLEALPQPYRQQFAELAAQEFPHFLAPNGGVQLSSQTPTIPADFYAQVIHTYTTSPAQLRSSSVCMLILQRILEHLDPHELGIQIALHTCVMSDEHAQIRSLRKTVGRVSLPWNSTVEQQVYFLGAESQAGHALISRHPIIMHNCEEKKRLFPDHYYEHEESSVAFPILLADRTVGVLSVASTQQNYFLQPQLDLLQSYVNLLVLAFEQHEFVELTRIELGVMPAREKQLELIAMFQLRVRKLMIEHHQEQPAMTRTEAEAHIWHQMEQELMHIRWD